MAIQKKAIYRIKEGHTLDVKDYFSKFVIVTEIVKLPISKQEFCIYKYIFIENMALVDPIGGSHTLPVNEFQQYFEFYKNIELHEEEIYNAITRFK